MTAKRAEGIILQTLKYQDYDQIATVFTMDHGILKFFVKGAYRSQNGKNTSPLARAEFIYTQGKSTLYNCKEVSLLNTYLNLRNNLTHLEAGIDLLKAVLESQMESKPAPELYKLLIMYLEKIPVIPDPWVLAASFLLKILRHDGLLAFDQSHESEEEQLLIQLLAFTRSFADLSSIQITPEFYQKIRALFAKSLQ
jgi:DNA repair protein RecO (recombination protein O)